jgi:Flp pilus assembly protein TadG
VRTRRRTDRGSAAVEVALVAPVFMALLMVVIYAGRVSQAQNEVQSAAAAAARAASQSSEATAADRAETAALGNLDAAEITCTPDVEVNMSNFQPGGSVQVTVYCDASLGDLMFLTFPTSQELRATSTEVIDTYRGGS